MVLNTNTLKKTLVAFFYFLLIGIITISSQETTYAQNSDSLLFYGLDHFTANGAKLRRDDQGFLEVLPNGTGSVIVPTQGAGFILPALRFSTPDSLPVGGSIKMIAQGGTDALSTEFLGSIDLVVDNSNSAKLVFDFANFLGTSGTNATIQIQDRDEIRTITENQPIPEILIPQCDLLICDPLIREYPLIRVDPFWNSDIGVQVFVDLVNPFDDINPLFSDPTPYPNIFFINGQEFTGEKLIFTLTVLDGVDLSDYQLNQVEISSRNIESFVIGSEGFGALGTPSYDGTPFYVNGNMKLAVVDNDLQVNIMDNIEMKGELIATFPNGAESFFAEINGMNLTDSGSLTLKALGEVDGERRKFLGQASFAHTGEGLEVTVNYDSIGATATFVDLYLEENQVSQTIVESGLIGNILDNGNGIIIEGCGKTPVLPIPIPCYHVRFINPVELQDIGGNSFIIDEIRLLAQGTQSNLGKLNSFSIGTSGISQFAMSSAKDVLAVFLDDKEKEIHNLKLWPNPVEEILNWEIENQIIEELEVYNSFGQRVLRIDMPGKDVNVSILPTGAYITRFHSRNQTWVAKFIKL